MVHFGQKRNPFCTPFIDKRYPGFIYLIYFATQNVQRKKERKKASNKNLRAYNIRLPQLQLTMATHAQL